jgi:hypothetical protein
MTVQLCDRSVLATTGMVAAFQRSGTGLRPPQNSRPELPGKAASGGPAFLDSVIPKALYMGADVNPVRTQLADYFGVKSGTGLLVESVDYQSPAARAGLEGR